jgi:hypothetical protein
VKSTPSVLRGGGEGTASCFESVGEETGVGEIGALDGCVAFEAHADETVVLGDDLISWSRKVEGVSFFGSYNVNHIQVRGIPPR